MILLVTDSLQPRLCTDLHLVLTSLSGLLDTGLEAVSPFPVVASLTELLGSLDGPLFDVIRDLVARGQRCAGVVPSFFESWEVSVGNPDIQR